MGPFEYVGPNEIRERAANAQAGTPISSRESLLRWLQATRDDVFGEGGFATYVIDLAGRLLVAPRRTEHVACASGKPVLAAGEIRFSPNGVVAEITNNSTGYCPSEDCWEAVRAAFDVAELEHPSAFTFIACFRRCPRCGERNLVKDEWFQCALCDAELPTAWNFAAKQG